MDIFEIKNRVSYEDTLEEMGGGQKRWPKGSSKGGQFAPDKKAGASLTTGDSGGHGGSPPPIAKQAGKAVAKIVAKSKTGSLSVSELQNQYKLAVQGPNGANREKVADLLKKNIATAQGGDMCKQSPPLCKGNLGISRDKMPQLGYVDKTTGKKVDVTAEFIDSYKKAGVKVTKEAVPVGKLKATQSELQAEKVLGMFDSLKHNKFPGIRDDIVVSKDGYILDGHHRWAALMMSGGHEKINVIRVDTSIKDLLKKSNSFAGVAQMGLKEQVEWHFAFISAKMRGAEIIL